MLSEHSVQTCPTAGGRDATDNSLTVTNGLKCLGKSPKTIWYLNNSQSNSHSVWPGRKGIKWQINEFE